MVVVIGFSFVALECLVLFEIWGLYVQTSRSNKKKTTLKWRGCHENIAMLKS